MTPWTVELEAVVQLLTANDCQLLMDYQYALRQQLSDDDGDHNSEVADEPVTQPGVPLQHDY